GDDSATQDEAFVLDLTPYFDDVDGDALSFVVSGLPQGLSATQAGVISGTPDNAVALASLYTATVTVSDQHESISDSVVLAVTNVNDTPLQLSTIGDQTLTLGDAIELDVSAHFSDPEQD